MVAEGAAIVRAAVMPLGSLDLYAGRAATPVVGRLRELTALARSIEAARARMVCLVFEGEPGIGKTRLLLAAEEQARSAGFTTIAVTADEEIRGPFLLARSIFGSTAAHDAAAATPAAESLQRALDALSNRPEPGLEGMSAEHRLLRVFDLAAGALRALGDERPLALLVDDVQWADEDSLRILRYLVRTDARSPVLLVLTVRPEETALVNEAVTLLADMDRLGILHRLRLGRLPLLDAAEFLQQTLGGRVNPSTAAVMQAQAEGVPFILEEQALAYREAGLIQQIDGVWTLARNAQRLLPSAVRTLIQRRAARLPDETKVALAEAAVVGRRFSLRDLADVRRALGTEANADVLATLLEPAVDTGLLLRHQPGSVADYTFTHEQVREYAAGTLAAARRRAVHAAIVDMLTRDGQDEPACLVLLAQHALAAGLAELGAQASVQAARAALEGNAPEEVLRLAELAQPVASSPTDRVALLRLRDDALGMLRRSAQRLDGLTELAALASALGDRRLELDVALRRAAALRLSEDYEVAATMARRVREQASELGDSEAELGACMELGQDLMCTELGEASTVTPTEADLDGAAEAFERAVALAREGHAERLEAAAERELGVIATSRVRAWFVERVERGEHLDVLRELLSGVALTELLAELPIAPAAAEAKEHFHRAFELYEGLQDRRGTMATIIAMATLSWAPEIHLTGSVRYIEEIRRLRSRMVSMTRESEQTLAEVQMLFGTQVYAQTRGFADLALTKGEAAHGLARARGEQTIEFASAGWLALQHAALGAIEEANHWLERAAAVATASPSSLRARQLELWRGMVQAAAGDHAGAVAHLERAAQLATEMGLAAARCEALAQLALAAAWLGSEGNDELLLAVAERAAHDARSAAARIPGHPVWGAQADAALARVALRRGQREAAVEAGRSSLAALKAAVREEIPLETILLAADAVLEAGAEPERAALRADLRLDLALIVRRIADEEVRARWFRSRHGRELVRLAGPLERAETSAAEPATPAAHDLDERERELLGLVVQGQTNREIGQALGRSESAVAEELAVLFAKIGVASRADATVAAFTGKLV